MMITIAKSAHNNIVCNISIPSGKTNQDCKDKDGNNPVTLGLENMRGVSTIVITINLSIIISIILLSVIFIIRCSSWSALG